MLGAGNGDALVVEYGDPTDVRRVLIDGGPWSSYAALRARIEALPPECRRFELLVVTHIDADHIDGVVRLLGDEDLGASFEQVWFNGYRHLSRVLAPKMGEVLSGLIAARGIPWNASFDGDAVVVPEQGVIPSVDLPGGARCTLLSPRPRNLHRLGVVWDTDADIRNAGVVPGTIEAARRLAQTDHRLDPLQHLLAPAMVDVSTLLEVPFRSDTSPTNASSIAFLMEYRGLSGVFAGDATPSVLVPSVRRLLDQRGLQALPVDVFKLPHHGSRSNVDRDLLRLLPARTFLLSSDGARHGHPDPEAVARVVTSTRAEPTLCFNYRTSFNERWADEALMDEHGYRVSYPPQGRVGMRMEVAEQAGVPGPRGVAEAHGDA